MAASRTYQVLARKWRPQVFADLAGLEHVTRTLQNAIRTNRVAHAFLFTGSRGVGKTSAARILAKCLNCRQGPAPEPCNECEQCLAITAGSSPDVIEIDAASNRGINEIRQLRENAGYLPQVSPCKVYIIDEVHMLTSEAFNALLKTLEEPPDHVKFILATTEPDRIPITILSRCQRYDFGRLSTPVIESAIAEIAGREGLEIEAAAVKLLAREAAGSMRDALSVLDQVISFAGSRITVDDLRRTLGVVEAGQCAALVRALLERRLPAALEQVVTLEKAGIDLKLFARELLFYLRHLVLLKLSPALEAAIEASSEEIQEMLALARQAKLPYWQQLFDLFQQDYDALLSSSLPRISLEMALVRLGTARDLEPLDVLLERLRDLEPRVSGPVPSPAAAGGEPAASPTPPPPDPDRASPAAAAPAEASAAIAPGAAPPVKLNDWPAFLKQLERQLPPALASLLDDSRLQAFDGERLEIDLPVAAYRLLAGDEEREEKLVRVLETLLGRRVRLAFHQREAAANGGRRPPEAAARKKTINKQEVVNDEIVRCLLETFGARIEEIR